MWIIAETTADLNVWRCNLSEGAQARGVSLAKCAALRTRDAHRTTALELRVRGTTDVCGQHGEPAIPSPARSAENPLGETARWVMKVPLQRDYIGVHGQRVVQESKGELPGLIEANSSGAAATSQKSHNRSK
jgi:hypothetical protein